MFMRRLAEKMVSAINEMIRTAMILKTNARRMIKGLFRLVPLPPNPTNPLLMVNQ